MKKLLYILLFLSPFCRAQNMVDIGINPITKRWADSVYIKTGVYPSPRVMRNVSGLTTYENNDTNGNKEDVMFDFYIDNIADAEVSIYYPSLFTLAPINSPALTSFGGIAFNGTTQYCSTTWNPFTSNRNYKVNNHYHLYWGVSMDSTSSFDCGAYDGTNAMVSLSNISATPSGKRTQWYDGFGVNQTTFSPVPSPYIGLRIYIRATTLPSGMITYLNGVSIGNPLSTGGTTAVIPSLAWNIGADNQSGTPTGFNKRGCYAFSAGAGSINIARKQRDMQWLRY